MTSQIGVSKRAIMLMIKPGSTRMQDGKIPINERIPYKICHHGIVVRFTLVYHQSCQSKFKLKTVERIKSRGIQKGDNDRIKGVQIAIRINMPA